ncbi:MAG: CidA/LrgA family protein [Erysipelotrichaceae bacterium]|nr:CidA/LrgA family protein [Erysipelotrichaceae bacterium]
MKYLKQMMIILSVSLVGELLHELLPLPVPASIYGIIGMFIMLYTGLIRVEQVRETSSFLIEIMPVMFVPAAVGLINSWDVLKSHWLSYVTVTLVSTVIVMAVSGLVTQAVTGKGGKGNE